MKANSIITIGLIASTTLIQVYGSESAPRKDRGNSSRIVTVTYQEPSPAETAPTLFGDLTDTDIRCLKYSGLEAVHVFNSGSVQKNTVQIIEIEPLSTRIVSTPDRHWIDEYLSNQQRPEPETFQWFDPRHVLLKWAEFWTTETDAQPVLLAKCEF